MAGDVTPKFFARNHLSPRHEVLAAAGAPIYPAGNKPQKHKQKARNKLSAAFTRELTRRLASQWKEDAVIKMVVEVWKKEGMTDEAFASRWLNQHGALVRRLAKPMGFLRYIQSHKVPSPEIEAFAAGRGWKRPPDGLTEVWWASKEAMQAALSSPEGQAASAELAVDEAEFIEASKISAFLATEEVIFDFTAAQSAA